MSPLYPLWCCFLSIGCRFLCLIPVGFYSKQLNVKPCSMCLHQMFYLFHPFWVALHWFLKSATKVQLLNCKSFKICEFHQKDFKSSAVSHLHCLKWQRCIKACLISRGGVLQAEINSHFLQQLPEVRCWFTLGKWAEWESCLLLVQCDCTQTCAS